MRELASLTGGCRLFAMLLRVYIDDSADQKQEKAVVAGAFVGKFGQWSELSTLWRRRLKRDGLKYFRSTEYYSLREEFARYRDPVKYPKPEGSEAACALREDLDAIIKKSQVMGVAAAIPLDLYNKFRETVPGAKDVFGKDAFDGALQSLIARCVRISKREFNGTHLSFVCDQSNSAPRILEVFRKLKQSDTDIAEIAEGLVHWDDKKFPPLQAADLMAHLAREYFMGWLADPNTVTLKRLQDSVYNICRWDWAFMQKVFLEAKSKGRIYKTVFGGA